MELVDSIVVRHQGVDRHVELFVGDLTCIPDEEAVDLLIVSAFPDSYAPTRRSLIGALERAGVSVERLAADKEVDLRPFSSCWLSRRVRTPHMNFRRILCFEPGFRGRASEMVGDVFRSIVPFTTGEGAVSRIAMPILASGHQGEPQEAMLEALADAAAHWLSIGLAVDRIKIVMQPALDVPKLSAAFARVKRRRFEASLAVAPLGFRFDLFVSYCQKDKEAVDHLLAEVRRLRSDLRIFVDRLELKPGAAWQQHIFDALDASRKVVCAFSPNYLESKVCKEEFNIALFRHRESNDGVLLPVYLYSASLPTYMKLVHYEDVREGDPLKMAAAARNLLRQF